MGNPRLFYAEWGLEQGADIEDVDGWYRANPALGIRISEEFVRSELDAMRATPEQFARERLGIPEIAEVDEEFTVVPLWLGLVDPKSSIASNHQVALDVSPDRRWSAFGGAGRRADGKLHVEAWEHRPGTNWVLEVGCASWQLRHLPIRIQTGSPAGAFILPFRERGVEVVEVSAADHAQALGQLQDACANDGLRHRGGVSLNAAAKGAVVRTTGDVDLLARRSSKVDITPLVAVTLAVGGVPTAVERKPRIHTLKEVSR